MYLVTRADLALGTQACQAAHAALDFAVTYPDLVGDWHASSNTLVILAVRDELALAWLCQDAERDSLRIARFHEPDLGGALTAVAFEPAAARLLRTLPLALPPAAQAPTADEADNGSLPSAPTPARAEGPTHEFLPPSAPTPARVAAVDAHSGGR